MPVFKNLRCNGTYEQNQVWHARRDIKKLNIEQLHSLADQIKTRKNLNGDQVQNQEVYNIVVNRIKELGADV